MNYSSAWQHNGILHVPAVIATKIARGRRLVGALLFRSSVVCCVVWLPNEPGNSSRLIRCITTQAGAAAGKQLSTLAEA